MVYLLPGLIMISNIYDAISNKFFDKKYRNLSKKQKNFIDDIVKLLESQELLEEDSFLPILRKDIYKSDGRYTGEGLYIWLQCNRLRVKLFKELIDNYKLTPKDAVFIVCRAIEDLFSTAGLDIENEKYRNKNNGK